MHTKLTLFLFGTVLSVATVGTASAAYQDLDDTDYEEYVLHLVDDIADPAAPGVGDITLGSEYGPVLAPPNGACGFYMEDVEGSVWTSPDYSEGPSPYHMTFELPLPGCGNNQVAVDSSNGSIALLPADGLLVQSWIAYWVDGNGDKISGFCPSCPGSAADDFLDSISSASRLLEVRLDLIAAALANDDAGVATVWLVDAINLQADNVVQLDGAIARRQRHDLGAVEASVASLENHSSVASADALQSLQQCQAFLAAGDVPKAEKACAKGSAQFKQANTALRAAGSLMQR